MALPRFQKEKAILIPAQRYWIGDDSTPNAGPRHLKTLQKPVWIDIQPVTLGDVQKCILHGKLIPIRKSPSDKKSQPTKPMTIDNLFLFILETTYCLLGKNNPKRIELSSLPACGLLWEEAIQVCNFFHARLPTEIEWEIALSWLEEGPKSNSTIRSSSLPVLSRLGCHSYAGVIQEWTSSSWTSRYWIEMDGKNPEQPIYSSNVSVRGCLPTAKVASQFARLSATIDDVTEPRIFRRVWDLVSESDL
jgi:formylglycine-generating enzyme required for sulfatase activity